MLTLDGSMGEGGGQILRTSLSLSVLTGKPFCIENIRAGRRKPGLRRQHLTAATAAGEIGRARLEGAEIGSLNLTFAPTAVVPGNYDFSVGTAGSAMLVLQTVLPPLVTADGPSRIKVEGGTHNIHAPPFDFVDKVFLPLIGRMGPRLQAFILRYGFFPAGGGKVEVDIRPTPELTPIELTERGAVTAHRIVAVISRLPTNIVRREVNTIQRKLRPGKKSKGMKKPKELVEVRQEDTPGPGNAVMLEIQSEKITELFTGFGEKGVPAERVAEKVVAAARSYLDAQVPVGPHLADQLLLPMALAGSGRFITVEPTTHTRTNIEVIQKFLDVRIETARQKENVWEVRVHS
jgi:RNA 3'-terminal phosphate cyclase (ATP)